MVKLNVTILGRFAIMGVLYIKGKYVKHIFYKTATKLFTILKNLNSTSYLNICKETLLKRSKTFYFLDQLHMTKHQHVVSRYFSYAELFALSSFFLPFHLKDLSFLLH